MRQRLPLLRPVSEVWKRKRTAGQAWCYSFDVDDSHRNGILKIMRQPFESVAPMLCRLEEKLPSGPDWVFEPNWDGFRGILFKDGGPISVLKNVS